MVNDVACSSIIIGRTNQLSGSVIGSLGDKAEDADRKAKTAFADSSTALSQAKDALAKAGKAAECLGKAEDEANKAQAASSNALTLARSARQEAHSFEQDIVSAKEKATKAEERTLRAESALLQFQETIQARRLSEKKKQELVKRLSGLPKVPFMVGWASDAMDGQIYAEDFIDVFSRLGWNPGPANARFEWLSQHIVVVFVIVHSVNDAVPQAASFLESLTKVGVAAKPGVDSGVPQHSFEIRIGAEE